MVCDEPVNRLACEFVREWNPFNVGGKATDGSRRITILLLERFKVLGSALPFSGSSRPSSISVSWSAISTPLNQPIPNSYGFARGEPFTLSILSSLLGNRIAVGGSPRLPTGYFGVFGGKAGLNVELDGTRCCVVGPGLLDGCLAGDTGRDGGRVW